MAALRIVPAEPSDRPWLAERWRATWGGESVVASGRVHRLADLPTVVARRGQPPVGSATYLIDDRACELVAIEAVEAHRGIGTALLAAVEAAARAAGRARLRLITTNDNLDALRFYQRRGYRIVAVHPGATDRARQIKAAIPVVGAYGIPIHDELELEKQLGGSMSAAPTVLDSFERPLRIVVRGCTAEDLPGLEWFGLHYHSRELIRAAYDRTGAGGVVMLVADVGGFPVGQVWIDFEKRQSVGVLWALRVIPCLQNLGIGTRLVRAAEEVVRQRGVPTAELGVEKANHAARRLYERLGYVVVGEEQEQWEYLTPDGTHAVEHADEWILQRSLTG